MLAYLLFHGIYALLCSSLCHPPSVSTAQPNLYASLRQCPPPNLYSLRVSAFSTYQAKSLFSSISNAVKPLPMKRKGLAVR